MSLFSENSQKFAQEGFLVVENLFDRETIDRTHQLAVDNFREAIGTITTKQLEFGIGIKNGFKEIVQRHPNRFEMPYKMDSSDFDFVLQNEELKGIVGSILECDDYIIANRSLVVSLPGCEDQGWHSDGPHMSMQQMLPCHCLNVFVPLVNVDATNGPTEFRPGSHFYTRDLAKAFLLAKIKKTLRTPECPNINRGSVLLFDYRVLHRGTANKSESMRPVLVFTFAKPWYKLFTNNFKQIFIYGQIGCTIMGARQAKIGRIIENPFKDKRNEPAIDLIVDSLEVLKRYDNMFRALILRGTKMGGFRTKPFTLLDREFTEADIGRSMRHSVLYFSTCHAYQGGQYVGDLLTNMQYTVLQAALILTITVTLYISPPTMDYDLQIVFSAIVGFSALCHLGTIISITILCAVFNGAMTDVDTTIMYIENHRIYASVTAFNYIAIAMALVSMLVAGFSRTYTEGYIQLVYSIVMIVVLLLIAFRSGRRVFKNNDIRAYRFYKHYCDADGQLKNEYLELVYPSDENKKSI